MSDFTDQINQFANDTDQRSRDVFDTSVELAKQSWQFGSPITGGPGVPVDLGALRNSIQRENLSATEAIVSTNLEYARSIEDGIGPHGPLTLRSAVGGFHALGQTVNNWDRIVDAAAKAHGG